MGPPGIGIDRGADGAAVLVMLVGRPASGKSYVARLLAERLGYELIQTDALRRMLFPRPRYTPAESRAVYAEAHHRIQRALRTGRSAIFDATNLRERPRRLVYRIADEAGARLVIALASAPVWLVRQRLAARAAGRDPLDASEATWAVFLRLGRPQPISRPHLLVNTAVDLRQAVELVAARSLDTVTGS